MAPMAQSRLVGRPEAFRIQNVSQKGQASHAMHLDTTPKRQNAGHFSVSSMKRTNRRLREEAKNNQYIFWQTGRNPKCNRAAGSSSMKPSLVKTTLQLYVIFAATPLHPVL